MTLWIAQSCLQSILSSKSSIKLLIGQNPCFGFEKPSQITTQAKLYKNSSIICRNLSTMLIKVGSIQRKRKKPNLTKKSKGIPTLMARLQWHWQWTCYNVDGENYSNTIPKGNHEKKLNPKTRDWSQNGKNDIYIG